MTKSGSTNGPEKRRLDLTYETHFLEDGRTLCGEDLARQLIDDALRLLLAVEAMNADRAWNKLWHLAAPIARRLDDEVKAGGNPSLVLYHKP